MNQDNLRLIIGHISKNLIYTGQANFFGELSREVGGFGPGEAWIISETGE